jgi:Zn-dependent protease
MRIGNVIFCLIVFWLSMSVRIAAQSWTSYYFGDDTSHLQGRTTLNVLPHLDPIGSVIFPVVTLLSGANWFFGWVKPLDVNPLRWRNPKMAQFVVAAAGLLIHFLLAAMAFMAIKLMLINGTVIPAPSQDASAFGFKFNLVVPVDNQPLIGMLVKQFNVLLLFNVMIGVFNLFPIPPLDGSYILESLLPDRLADSYEQIRPYGFMLIVGLAVLGVFGIVLTHAINLIRGLLFG